VTGGSTKHFENSIATTEMLQKDTNRWITFAKMKECRHNHGMAAMKGYWSKIFDI